MYDQLRQWHIRRLNVDAETSVHPKALCHVPIACMDNAAEHVSLAYRALSGGCLLFQEVLLGDALMRRA